MDSKRFNIYAGSILGALLIFLLLNFFSSLLYIGPEHGGHEEEVLAFAVPVEEEGGGEGEGSAGPDWAALLAEADPADGEKVFNKCKACHSAEKGQHGVGPSLYGVVGHDIAAVEGFSFSPALTSLEGDWTFEKLVQWLQDPQGFAPGTKMSFSGLNKPEDVVNVIVYINQHADSPVELSAPQTAKAAEGGEAPAQEGGQEGGQQGGQQAEQPATEQPATEQQAAQQQGEQAGGDAGGGAFAELLANASAENGEKVYRKCQACHTLEEGKHRVGPSLHGLIGGDIASAQGFSYSEALSSKEGKWTLESLDAWLENPNDFAPGNKMTFPGVRDAQDRIDVLTYIDESDGERDLPK